jgi:hypothetical protein
MGLMVTDMVHPSAMQTLARERENEIQKLLEIPRAPASFPKVRERLGWSLISLGLHVALTARRGRPVQSLTRS